MSQRRAEGANLTRFISGLVRVIDILCTNNGLICESRKHEVDDSDESLSSDLGIIIDTRKWDIVQLIVSFRNASFVVNCRQSERIVMIGSQFLRKRRTTLCR